MIGPLKVSCKKHALYRHLAINKAKNGHFGFNLSNSLFYQKTNGIFKNSEFDNLQ